MFNNWKRLQNILHPFHQRQHIQEHKECRLCSPHGYHSVYCYVWQVNNGKLQFPSIHISLIHSVFQNLHKTHNSQQKITQAHLYAYQHSKIKNLWELTTYIPYLPCSIEEWWKAKLCTILVDIHISHIQFNWVVPFFK